MLNVFPALPIVIVLSHMPGRVAIKMVQMMQVTVNLLLLIGDNSVVMSEGQIYSAWIVLCAKTNMATCQLTIKYQLCSRKLLFLQHCYMYFKLPAALLEKLRNLFPLHLVILRPHSLKLSLFVLKVRPPRLHVAVV